jgi:hypothetical protein
MPIRMVDDQNDQQEEYKENTGGRGGGGGGFNFPGGGGGLMKFLPLLFTLFRGKKSLLLLLIIGGGYFLLTRNGGCNMSSVVNKFSQGGELNADSFRKASVYEQLDGDNPSNALPERVSLERFAPTIKNQGQQGSCVAWSSTYAARTILEAASTGAKPDQIAYSPAYTYNQIGLEGCQGSYIIKAMELMNNQGAVAYNEFPYDESSCERQPPQSLLQTARANRMNGFTRLTNDEGTGEISIRAIKEHLAKDVPVVIGMMVGQSFMQGMLGQKVWYPTNSDHSQMGFGGHAMCVIGYDDRLEGGAFQIMNSWGKEWGENGIGYVRYPDFKEFVREAYGVNPMPKRGAAANAPFACEMALVKWPQREYIPLQYKNNNLFESTQAIPINQTFKIELANSNECYVYVFGQETDGSSYTLFPYPSKADPTKSAFSPFCGITGSRLFPRGKSLAPDNVGTKDYMAVVVSKKELNWVAVNQAISSAGGGDYAAKVAAALRAANPSAMQVSAGKTAGAMRFEANAGDNNAITFAVVAINKR